MCVNIVHGDIKPDNLLITSTGTVKIGDFSVSQVFEEDNDELRRSPGTPVFTAPECCLGLTYHGKAADTWAIVNNPLNLPNDMNPELRNLLEGLLCKDTIANTGSKILWNTLGKLGHPVKLEDIMGISNSRIK
ncbi:Protein kinase domain - like 10 [Theobroma cacao]|nr:Protein kinase domain - like 10 [Theobroma cacao]